MLSGVSMVFVSTSEAPGASPTSLKEQLSGRPEYGSSLEYW